MIQCVLFQPADLLILQEKSFEQLTQNLPSVWYFPEITIKMTKKLAVPYWLSVLYILWLISVLYQLKINLVRWEFKFFCKFFKSILILNYMYIKSFILWSFLSLRHYMNTHVYFKTVCACASIWQSMYIQYSRFSIEQYGTITSYLNLLIQQCRGLCNNILQSLFQCGWGGGVLWDLFG